MSTILFLFSIIILIFIDKKNRVIFFSSLAVFLIIAAFLINRDDSIKNRYENLYKRFQAQENIENEVKKTVEKKEEEKAFDKKVDPYESFHFRIYLTVIESWKNNPIMGWGHKSFRNVCKNITIENIKIEDKSFLHKNHPGNQKGKFHLKLMIKSKELKKLNKIDSNKKIYSVLNEEIKNFIHSIQLIIN